MMVFFFTAAAIAMLLLSLAEASSASCYHNITFTSSILSTKIFMPLPSSGHSINNDDDCKVQYYKGEYFSKR